MEPRTVERAVSLGLSMWSTRRDVLAFLLGAPFAAGCRKRAETPRFSGEFVGSAEDGHLIREAAGLLSQKPAKTHRVGTLILGGGVAGLSSAYHLRKSNPEHSVVLLEMGATLGGTSASGESAVTRFPWGAHYLPVPSQENRPLCSFLSDVGVLPQAQPGARHLEGTLVAEPKERVFYSGRWHQGLFPHGIASADDERDFVRFTRTVNKLCGPVGENKERAFSIPVSSSIQDAAALRLDAMSFAEWFESEKFSSRLLRWWLDYATRDDFGLGLEQASAWYGLHYFAARRDPVTKESADFLTWPEGNARLVAGLATSLRSEEIRLRALVLRVVQKEGEVAVDVFDREKRRMERYRAATVVFALPSFLRPYLIENDESDYQVRYSPWLVANIHLRARPKSVGFEQSWDNVIYGSRSLGYVVATHQTAARPGPSVWTYYLPLGGEDEKKARRNLESLSWEEASDAVFSELASCHQGLAGCVERIDVKRLGHAMVGPVPGTLNASSRRDAQKQQGRIHFAHTDLSGVALFEEAFFHGYRAAREISL